VGSGGVVKMPTSARVFIDSTILLYAVDKSDSARRATARKILRDLIRSGKGVVSTQVAQEFYAIATRKLGVEPLAAKRVVELLRQIEVVSMDLELVCGAIDCSIRSKISFGDALIVTTARAASCREVLSEDLSHSQVINGVRIVNPFKAARK
jgi:predicted nucleic acid-binding protein